MMIGFWGAVFGVDPGGLAAGSLTNDLAAFKRRWECELLFDFNLKGLRTSWRSAAVNLVSFLTRKQKF